MKVESCTDEFCHAFLRVKSLVPKEAHAVERMYK